MKKNTIFEDVYEFNREYAGKYKARVSANKVIVNQIIDGKTLITIPLKDVSAWSLGELKNKLKIQ